MAENPDDQTIIAAGSTLRGQMTINGAAEIHGNFEGSIQGEGSLHIVESGQCKGDIYCGKVTVDGTVEGNISASERIQLNEKGSVVGDIAAKKMDVSSARTRPRVVVKRLTGKATTATFVPA